MRSSSPYAGEERGLRLAALEALAALIALQPTAVGGRLAAGGALPHLARWLRHYVDEYLLADERNEDAAASRGARGAPADVVRRATEHREAERRSRAAAHETLDEEEEEEGAGSGGTPAEALAGADGKADHLSEAESLDARKLRSASGAPAAVLLLSIVSVIMRLKAGRECVDEVTALSLIETCAAAALLSTRSSVRGRPSRRARPPPPTPPPTPPTAKDARREAAGVVIEGGQGDADCGTPTDEYERKGELKLMLDLLLSVSWGASAALPRAPLPAAPRYCLTSAEAPVPLPVIPAAAELTARVGGASASASASAASAAVASPLPMVASGMLTRCSRRCSSAPRVARAQHRGQLVANLH